ncbi:MAG: RDD family protein [Lachnospiraceae bacterium]|nr:RDD family protein [Lachnospiraceae bacterium]MBQ2319806.1 RDD family protein [Lachnospiraceae bacterium]
MQNNNDRTYAGFFVRLAAYIVDITLVSLMLLIIKTPFWIISLASPDNFLVKDFIFQYSVMDIVLYLLKVTYFILLTYYTGSTLGKKLFRIEVISSENRKLTFFEVAYRETVGKFLSAVIIYIGYIMAGLDEEKKGLHDILSDTRVVYKQNEKQPLPQQNIVCPQNGTEEHVCESGNN